MSEQTPDGMNEPDGAKKPMSAKRKAVIGVLIAVACAAGGTGVYMLNSQRQAQRDLEDLRDQVVTEADPAETAAGTEAESEPYVSPVDFEQLQLTNPDVYAWITVPGTVIDYPVVQARDDMDFYLHRAWDRSSSYSGSVFSEPGRSKELTDSVTILYGHNMADGSMFGTLKRYRDENYRDEHREICLYTADGAYTYEVFAAVVYDDRLITAAYDLDTQEGVQDFLDSLAATRNLNSWVADDVTVTPEDRVLVLSTCTNSSSERYLVCGVLR